MLDADQTARYSRQLLLPTVGVRGQQRLCAASVLVVGAGGIGSPVIMYLAAAGVGHIGIVDYDDVEASNLQRQVVHSERTVGRPKADSAAEAVANLSSLVRCTPFNTLLDSSNVLDIVRQFDVVVDATDNVATRYLLSDACVFLSKPLVSGSALRMDGQLTVYNLDGGPCYRCIFPVPPLPETVTNCSEGGVLGVVPGIIGSIQALEVIKIIVGMPAAFSQKMLLLDAELGSFRTVRLRAKNADCAVCGINPSITAPIDYVQFCGASAHDKTPDLSLLEPHKRISVEQLRQARDARTPHVLLDVRDKIQVDICALDRSLHIPLNKLDDEIGAITDRIRAAAPPGAPPESVPVYAICRRGNDSQLAVQKLKARGIANALDVIGGLREWSRSVDPTFPSY